MATNDFNRPFTKAEMDAMRGMSSGEKPRDEARVLGDAWATLRRVARRIPFAEDVLALYFCARDPGTSRKVRWIIVGALAYFALPVDAIPDLLPLAGFTDDAAVIAAAIAAVRGSITDRHRDKARDALAQDGLAQDGMDGDWAAKR